MAKVKQAYAFVVTQEHYHFAPHDDDMVAATPLAVFPGTESGKKAAMVDAYKRVRSHADRFAGEIREYTGNGSECYRAWVHSESPHCDVFVWMVRRVDYFG